MKRLVTFRVSDRDRTLDYLKDNGYEYKFMATEEKSGRDVITVTMKPGDTLESIEGALLDLRVNPILEAQIPADWDPEDIEEWEAIQKERERERDPEYHKMMRDFEAAKREPSEKEQAEIEGEAKRKQEIWHDYAKLRVDIANALDSVGITDFELYGAGGKRAMGEKGFEQKEMLSPLEYQGALRVVGPVEGADEFVNIVTDVAKGAGFKVDFDRPPSVTHLFGQTIRSKDGESPEIQGRPFLYIYRTYRSEWPTEYEREMARRAGVSRDDSSRLWGSINVYENRVSEIAHEITDDPHQFVEALGSTIAAQIGRTPEFKIVREEIKDATANSIDLQRALHMPIRAGDCNIMIYFLAEAQKGNILIDLLGCPPELSKDAITKLSEMMIH